MKTAKDVRDILKEVRYLDWTFFVGEDNRYGLPTYLQVQFNAACTTSGDEQSWKGRKWVLSPHMTKSEIVTTAFKAVMTAIEHEARESFKYKGYAIFGPHIDVDYMVHLHKFEGVMILDVRPENNNDNRNAIAG